MAGGGGMRREGSTNAMELCGALLPCCCGREGAEEEEGKEEEEGRLPEESHEREGGRVTRRIST